jgi:acyl-CoA dehydrogenase
MKLAFDTELEELRGEFCKPLSDVALGTSLKWIESGTVVDRTLWERLAGLGWLGSAIPEACGGSGLEEIALCVQAEEFGRALAPIPFVSSVCGYAIGVYHAADEKTRSELLPSVAQGETVGLLLTEDTWRNMPSLEIDAGRAYISGATGLVPDGASATAALACVQNGNEAVIVQIDLTSAGRTMASDSLDLLHPCASFRFDKSPARILTRGASTSRVWQSIIDRYALFTAFEQLGGAAAALEMARSYTLQRYAFGRPIASFQGLKHSFADLFVALDLARSNCFFGAAALNSMPERLHEAAAVARISATDAFRRCARGNMQMHGAMGVTWQSGCHLYYRRAQVLAGHPGALNEWKESLIRTLLEREAGLNAVTAD